MYPRNKNGFNDMARDAGRRTDFFLRPKIERFFWRDFSGEELLPENSFLG